MEKIYIRDENDSLHGADFMLLQSLGVLSQTEAKNQADWTEEEGQSYLEALAWFDLSYWLLSRKDNPKLMHLEELNASFQGQGIKTPSPNNVKTRSEVFVNTALASDFTVLTRVMKQVFSIIKFIAIPALVLIISGGWFGPIWKIFSNIGLVVMLLALPLVPLLRVKTFKNELEQMKSIDTSFQSIRANVREAGAINEVTLEKWLSLKNCNPELFTE